MPWLYTPNLFLKRNFRRGEKNPTKHVFFVFLFFFFVLLIFQLGICSSMAHPTPSKMPWEGAICGFPLLIYFQKTLQSDINCFDGMHLFVTGMHLFVAAHRCQLSCLFCFLVFFFSLSSSNHLALHPNVCVGSAQRESVRRLQSCSCVGSTFWTYQVGPTHVPLLESLDSSSRLAARGLSNSPPRSPGRGGS